MATIKKDLVFPKTTQNNLLPWAVLICNAYVLKGTSFTYTWYSFTMPGAPSSARGR